jgi:exocyst complex component 4
MLNWNCRARTRLATVKESLKACKELLHYKRDELKKLWLDGVEQKHVLELLRYHIRLGGG